MFKHRVRRGIYVDTVDAVNAVDTVSTVHDCNLLLTGRNIKSRKNAKIFGRGFLLLYFYVTTCRKQEVNSTRRRFS